MYDYKDIGHFFTCEVKCEEPSNKIYDFNATFSYPNSSGDDLGREL
jgi:hypothetical protein